MSHLKIGDRRIGPGEPCYIIAEAGLAHLGSLDLALSILADVRGSGAEAFKTQVFGPKCVTHRQERRLSEGSLVELKVKTKIRGVGMHFILTPHDLYGVDLIKEIGVDAVKLGSGARGNLGLIQAVTELGKPVIASLGGYSVHELVDLVEILSRECDFALLHCVSKYPVPVGEADLVAITPLKSYGVPVGYSDHCESEIASCIAVALGACIVEAHVRPSPIPIIDTSMDQRVSIGADRFCGFVQKIRDTERMVYGKRD